MLQIKDFEKSYGDNVILRVPDLTIGDGVFMFQGHNGSGKSTFFKAISGMIPFDGEAILDQKYFLSKDPLAFRRYVNYSAAEPQYPDFVSGKEIIEYYLKVKGGTKKEIDHHIESLQVGGFYKNPIGTYSSGMLKKISLIAALCGYPKILALDELLTTIDIDSQHIFLEILKQKVAEGVNVFLASHHEIDQNLLPVNQYFKVQSQTIIPV